MTTEQKAETARMHLGELVKLLNELTNEVDNVSVDFFANNSFKSRIQCYKTQLLSAELFLTK
jgi:hypothetical protein